MKKEKPNGCHLCCWYWRDLKVCSLDDEFLPQPCRIYMEESWTQTDLNNGGKRKG